MMITTNALCDDRPVRIAPSEEFRSYWGSAFICCDECISIVSARESWREVYA